MPMYFASSSGSTTGTDKVKVSSNDTTASYLEDKIVSADTKLVVTTINDGANEDVQLAVDQTKIDHDSLLNFTATEHFTMLDEDDLGTDSDTQAATQQSIKAYVDALGMDPEKVYTVSPSGANYTTIQAALTAHTAGGELFLVFPGTYTDDTINFTANNQAVKGMSNSPSKIIVTNTAQICDFGAFTGCIVTEIKLIGTYTSDINLVTGTGSCNFYRTHLESNISGTIAAAPAIIETTGTVKIAKGTVDYTNAAISGGQIKAAFVISTGGSLIVSLATINIAGSNAAAATTTFFGNDTGRISVNESTITVVDSAATLSVGLAYVSSTAENEILRNNIHVTNNVGTAYGLYLLGGVAAKLRSMHNHYHCISSGGATTFGFVGASTTLISQFDDVIATNDVSNSGTYTRVNSLTDGSLTLTNNATVLGTVTAGSLSTGSVVTGLATKTGDYSVGASDCVLVADGTSATVAITLPAPASGRTITVKAINVDNAVSILPNAAETIDGEASLVFSSAYECHTVISDGTNWFRTSASQAVLG